MFERLGTHLDRLIPRHLSAILRAVMRSEMAAEAKATPGYNVSERVLAAVDKRDAAMKNRRIFFERTLLPDLFLFPSRAYSA
jgi:hypothetical protein